MGANKSGSISSVDASLERNDPAHGCSADSSFGAWRSNAPRIADAVKQNMPEFQR